MSHPNPQAEYGEDEIGTPLKPSQRIEEIASYSTRGMYCSLCSRYIPGEELPLHVSHFQIAAAEEQKEAAIIQKLYYQKLYSNPDEQHAKSGIIS